MVQKQGPLVHYMHQVQDGKEQVRDQKTGSFSDRARSKKEEKGHLNAVSSRNSGAKTFAVSPLDGETHAALSGTKRKGTAGGAVDQKTYGGSIGKSHTVGKPVCRRGYQTAGKANNKIGELFL